MRAFAAVLVIATAACSQRVYSPPSQAYSLGPLTALPRGSQALDLEVSRHAQIFDPAIEAGAARLRVGVDGNTELSIEGSALTVDDDGPSSANRNLYSGRTGIRWSPKPGVALFGGLGGGYAPAGGTFAAGDAGIAVGYHNCTLVPVAQVSGFASVPLEATAVDVSVDDKTKVFDTPGRTAGVVVRGGLRLSLAPSTCRSGKPSSWITVGAGFTTLKDADSSAALFGLGLGLELPL
ncbi:MAG: hypothetical protein ABI867_40045 [Kofleriaceae bacterium]